MPATVAMPGGPGSQRLSVAKSRTPYWLMNFACKLVCDANPGTRMAFLCLVVDGVTTFRLPALATMTSGTTYLLHFANVPSVFETGGQTLGDGTVIIPGNLPPTGFLVQPSDLLQLVIDNGQAGDVISEVNMITSDGASGVTSGNAPASRHS